jgi:hypothetical protein
MTRAQLPLIYNLDKFRIYDNHLLKVEEWLGAQSIGWYVKECEHLKEFANRKVEDMTICIEGCFSEVVVLEIFLK